MKCILNLVILAIIGSISAQECELYDLKSINLANWKSIPHVKGRLATKADVENDRAIYVSAGTRKNSAVNLEIPFLACIIDARTESRDTVVVIQADKTNGEICTGFRIFHDGGYGTALLKDFDVIISYEQNLNIASSLYLEKSEIPKAVLKKLVPEDNMEFGMYYSTTWPDHKLAHTDFFYETTRLIFEQTITQKNDEFYLPSLKLISF
ncbi:MAG: hypothetical protein AAGF77_01645, partial [Bacteroidota bacterium]